MLVESETASYFFRCDSRAGMPTKTTAWPLENLSVSEGSIRAWEKRCFYEQLRRVRERLVEWDVGGTEASLLEAFEEGEFGFASQLLYRSLRVHC